MSYELIVNGIRNDSEQINGFTTVQDNAIDLNDNYICNYSPN